MADRDPFDEEYWNWDYMDDQTARCPTCRGTGEVNALTAPADGPFVASYADCPHCDGTGEI